MLDGAAKVKKLLAKAVELGQSAVASTDHGNVFSHYDMWSTAQEMREKDGVDIRVILGCELYVAPASRFHKAPIFWGSRGNSGSKGDSETKDVSGAGAFTHMTMVATNGPGLNALFELTSRASIEGAYAKVGPTKPRIDAELLAEVIDNWPGAQLVGTTGCPSGAVQTRLRLGQWDKALEEAAVWRDILGEGNYFVELMDHGNGFEAASRPQLMELAKAMNLPLLATNDSHYVEPTQAKMHDALLCQPPGTLVRRVVPRLQGGGVPGGQVVVTEEVPIEEVRAGDRVVSWDGKHRRGAIRKRGSLVTQVASREYSGEIVGVQTPTGATSRYTSDHKTVVRLDTRLEGGNYVVYLMRKGDWFRVGVTQYRRDGGGVDRVRAGHDLGPMYRLKEEQADAIWILSVHETMDQAREQEAWVGFKHNIPTWTFTKPDMRAGGRKAFYADLWDRVGNLTSRGEKCLAEFGRDIRFPLLTKGSLFIVKPQVLHACNLMSGMLVCEPEPGTTQTYDATGTWKPVEVFREDYVGTVYSMNVEGDHTYVADGIVTHNCLQMGKKLSDTDRMKFDGSGYHLRSAKEMRDLFKELPEACDNTLEIADRVAPDAYDEVLSYKDDLLPEYPVPDGHTPATYLREVVTIGLQQKYPDPEGPDQIQQEAWDRVLGYEIPVIERMNYPSYMLMVWDFVKWARENNIRVGPGRGSAAGSGTSYALDITTVPTLEHGLLFERFINPERVSPPDVDVDFEKLKRDQVFRYLAERWGEENVCRIQTLGTIKAKAALKDAGRVLGKPYGLGEKLTKAFPKAISGFDAPLSCVVDEESPRYADAQDFRDLLAKEVGAQEVYDLACELEGLIRSTGVHACGFVVSSRPLMGRIPLVWSEKDQQMVSGFPNASVLEPMGFLKVDCLGLDTMDVITLAVDMIRERHGIDVDDLLDKLDDPAAYQELASGHTVGMFQVASSGMSKLLQMMKADRFEDISAGLALYRPGPMAAEAHTDYALRKTGRQKIRAIHPDLEEALRDILGPTYGVICYQEQIMKSAQKVAGYSLGQADLLRKIMGKKKPEALAKAKPPFFEGMKKEGYGEDAAQALWDVFEPFSAYAFNVAHTVSYGHITYATAYLKAHYPAEFMAALLTMAGDDKDKLALYLGETRRMGLKVLVPDVNEAAASFTPTADGVRFGLNAVSGLGPKAVSGIISARQDRPFRTFADFLDRIPETTCTKGAVKALIRGGGFDSLGYTRNALDACYENGVGAYRGDKKKQSEGQFDLFSAAPEVDFHAVTVPDLPEWDDEEKLAFERKALGTWVSGHPLTRLAGVLAGNRTITLAQLATDEPTEGTFQISGQIVEIEHKVGKASGRGYAILSLEDLTGRTEIRLLGRGYEEFRHMLTDDRRVTVKVYLKTEMKQRPGGEEYEETSLFVATIDDLDMSKVADEADPREPNGLVLITLDALNATELLVMELKETLQEHPGDRPVWIKLICAEGPQLYNLPGFNVSNSTELRGELKGLRGLSGVRF
jgi:DNA polymerase-3 subunit alpha